MDIGFAVGWIPSLSQEHQSIQRIAAASGLRTIGPRANNLVGFRVRQQVGREKPPTPRSRKDINLLYGRINTFRWTAPWVFGTVWLIVPTRRVVGQLSAPRGRFER